MGWILFAQQVLPELPALVTEPAAEAGDLQGALQELLALLLAAVLAAVGAAVRQWLRARTAQRVLDHVIDGVDEAKSRSPSLGQVTTAAIRDKAGTDEPLVRRAVQDRRTRRLDHGTGSGGVQ